MSDWVNDTRAFRTRLQANTPSHVFMTNCGMTPVDGAARTEK